MSTKMHHDFVPPKPGRTGPMSVHYDKLESDLDGWYRFSREEVGTGGCDQFKSNLHGGARSRGLRAHTMVDHDVPGGVIACFYDPAES